MTGPTAGLHSNRIPGDVMLLDQFLMMLENENVHIMKPEDLKLAVAHLYKALDLLAECRKTLESGLLDYEFSQKLADGWLEVNKCRIYTEMILSFEEILIPCMGLINDAKSMFDSLVASRQGMTRHGYLNIMQCMNEAVVGVSACLEELESWMEPE